MLTPEKIAYEVINETIKPWCDSNSDIFYAILDQYSGNYEISIIVDAAKDIVLNNLSSLKNSVHVLLSEKDYNFRDVNIENRAIGHLVRIEVVFSVHESNFLQYINTLKLKNQRDKYRINNRGVLYSPFGL